MLVICSNIIMWSPLNLGSTGSVEKALSVSRASVHKLIMCVYIYIYIYACIIVIMINDNNNVIWISRRVGPGRTPQTTNSELLELRTPNPILVELGVPQKGTNEGSTNGVIANLMFSDREFVFPLTYVYLPKSARAYLFPQSVKINHSFAAAPLVLTPFVPTKALRRGYVIVIMFNMYIYIYIYIYIYMYGVFRRTIIHVCSFMLLTAPKPSFPSPCEPGTPEAAVRWP